MRRLAFTLVAASVLLGGTSLVIAQTTTTTTTVVPRTTIMAAPTYYSDYYKVAYYKPPPSMAEMAQILINAGYTNPTDLVLNGDVWTGKATTMGNHQVAVRFDREGIWQLTK
jgi:hypothetical protein